MTASPRAHSAPSLTGIRLLDLSFFTPFTPGPFASRIPADPGATVLKVEAPGGDRERHVVLGFFAAFNRGKHSITLDLKNPDDLALCPSA